MYVCKSLYSTPWPSKTPNLHYPLSNHIAVWKTLLHYSKQLRLGTFFNPRGGYWIVTYNDLKLHFLFFKTHQYLSKTCCGSSSIPGFSRSVSVASTLSFQSSSNLAICVAETWRALNCSWSVGIFTNHDKKQRSAIRGFHCSWSLKDEKKSN